MCFNERMRARGAASAAELAVAGGKASLRSSLLKFGTPGQQRELGASAPHIAARGIAPPSARQAAPTESFEELMSPEAWPKGVTTALIRNIACRFTQEDICAELDTLGFAGHYESVCVPRSRMMNSNLGYAFVKFHSSDYAKLCRQVCQGKVFGQSQTKKLCEVVPAHIQDIMKSKAKGRKRLHQKGADPLPAPMRPLFGAPSLPAPEAFSLVHTSTFAGVGMEASERLSTLAVFPF